MLAKAGITVPGAIVEVEKLASKQVILSYAVFTLTDAIIKHCFFGTSTPLFLLQF